MEPDTDLIRRLDERIRASLDLPLQVRGGPHGRAADPLRGVHVLINTRRATRPQEGDAGCFFCNGQTPPTLFYMEETAGGRSARPLVESEQESLSLVRRYRDSLGPGEEPDPWESLRLLGEARHTGPDGDAVPLVNPARPWLARTFFNFVPLLMDPGSRANCFVVSVPPSFHDYDLGELLSTAGEGGSRVLPPAVLEAVVRSWIVLEEWSREQGLMSVPFINGGKSRASGQSIDHFHSQLYALGPADEPPLYRRLAKLRRSACPVCDIVGDEELRVRTFGTVIVALHPAPSHDLTFVVAPREDWAHLAELDAADFAAALSWAVRRYEVLLGGVPAYVVGVRTGDLVGHLHAEVVPRSNVNIPGGFEETSGLAVATRDPRKVARVLREA